MKIPSYLFKTKFSGVYSQCKGYQFKYKEDNSVVKKINKSKYLRRSK